MMERDKKNAEQWCFSIGETDEKLLTIGVSATGKVAANGVAAEEGEERKAKQVLDGVVSGVRMMRGMGCFCDWEEVKSADQRSFGVGGTVTSVFQRCFGIKEMNSAAQRSFSIGEVNSAAQRSFSIMKNHQCCKTVFQHRESLFLL
jgi:hypothetical protein